MDDITEDDYRWVLFPRYYAQKIFFLLMSHEDFDKMMHKYVPSQSLRNIQDKLDTLRKKVRGCLISMQNRENI